MVTITIKETTKQAKAIIELLRTMPFVEIHEKDELHPLTLKSIKEGKVIKAKNTKELMKKLLA